MRRPLPIRLRSELRQDPRTQLPTCTSHHRPDPPPSWRPCPSRRAVLPQWPALSPSTLSPSLSGFVLLVYFVGVLFGFREFGGKMQKRKGYSQFKLLSLAEFEVINYVGTPA